MLSKNKVDLGDLRGADHNGLVADARFSMLDGVLLCHSQAHLIHELMNQKFEVTAFRLACPLLPVNFFGLWFRVQWYLHWSQHNRQSTAVDETGG